MKALPKILFVFFLLTTSFLFSGKLSKNVYAVDPTPSIQPYWEVGVEDLNQQMRTGKNMSGKGQTPISYPFVKDFQIKADLYSLIRLVTCPVIYDKNKSPQQMLEDAGCNPENTALYNLNSVMQAFYLNPPASFAWYIQDTLANAGLAKPAYAQGIGFAGLTPLLSIWKATRNIAYAVIVLVMVAIGFMVIFRMKIDPKTVISIQAALPKIVFTLILITFSYAIVGFLIDLMYLVIALVIQIIAGSMGKDPNYIADFQSQFMTGGMTTLAGHVFSGGFRSLDDFVKGLWWTVLPTSGLAALLGGLGILGFPGWGMIIAGTAIATAPAWLLLAILVLGLLYVFIRLVLLLFNSYIQVLIALILGPLILLNEAIPGKSAFGEWIQNIIANLVVFPATVAILMFGTFLTTLNENSTLWAPPLIGMPGFSGSAGPNLFSAFIGLGVILISPNLIAQIKKAFGPKPALPVSPGTLLSPLTSTFQTGMGAMSQFYYFQMLRDSLTRQHPKTPTG